MLTPLRQSVQAMLADTPSDRRPALRRASRDSALLATDLPLAARAEDVRVFIARAEQAGWQVWEEGGWLWLDHPVPPPRGPMPEAFPGEAGCCLWLLTRHPGDERAPRGLIRALAKAQEAGVPQVERLCAAWHRDFAERLRRHQPLPGGLAPYLRAVLANREGGTPA